MKPTTYLIIFKFIFAFLAHVMFYIYFEIPFKYFLFSWILWILADTILVLFQKIDWSRE